MVGRREEIKWLGKGREEVMGTREGRKGKGGGEVLGMGKERKR